MDLERLIWNDGGDDLMRSIVVPGIGFGQADGEVRAGNTVGAVPFTTEGVDSMGVGDAQVVVNGFIFEAGSEGRAGIAVPKAHAYLNT